MHAHSRVLRLIIALTFVIGAVFTATTVTHAQAINAECTTEPSEPISDGGITPVFCEGQTSCQQAGYASGWKIEGDFTGVDQTFDVNTEGELKLGTGSPSVDGAKVKITSEDGRVFAWASNLVPIDAVIVKGGPDGNTYVYEGTDLTSDSGLAPPPDPNNPAISNIQFCWGDGAEFIELDKFNATVEEDVVTISWTTSVEVDNVGFFVYRSESAEGELLRVNSQMVAANGNREGGTYTITDVVTEPGVYWYTLEDIDINGRQTTHEPVLVIVGGQRVFLPFTTTGLLVAQ